MKFILFLCLLVQISLSQSLVQTSDGSWMSAQNFAQERLRLEQQDIHFSANGTVCYDTSSKQFVVVTAAHVFSNLKGGKILGSDAVCFPLRGIEKEADQILILGNWNPQKPVLLRSFLPHQNKIVEMEIRPKKADLFSEMAVHFSVKRARNSEFLATEAYAEVPEDESGENLFVPGVSGSPLIQDGKVVGVLSWSLLESKDSESDQLIGLCLFGQKPRSSTFLKSASALIVSISLFLIIQALRFAVRKLLGR